MFGTGSIVEVVDGDSDLVVNDAVHLGHIVFCRLANLVGRRDWGWDVVHCLFFFCWLVWLLVGLVVSELKMRMRQGYILPFIFFRLMRLISQRGPCHHIESGKVTLKKPCNPCPKKMTCANAKKNLLSPS